jgi:hypothetical protein
MIDEEPSTAYPITAIAKGKRVSVYLVTDGGHGLLLGSAAHAVPDKALKAARYAALRTLATLLDDLESVSLEK